jgi:putative restriction endonuclease
MSRDVFLVPVTQPEFERTAQSPIDLTELSIPADTLSELENPEEVRVWGVKNSQLNREFYNKMNQGDALLFYHRDEYRYFGIAGCKFQNEEISEEYWGGISADMLYEIKSFRPISVSRERLNNACDYKESYQPQSIRRMSNTAYRQIRRQYGDIETFIEAN